MLLRVALLALISVLARGTGYAGEAPDLEKLELRRALVESQLQTVELYKEKLQRQLKDLASEIERAKPKEEKKEK